VTEAAEGRWVERHGVTRGQADVLTVALVADALDAIGSPGQVLDPAIRPVRDGLRLVGWARTVDVRATDVAPDEPYVGEMAAIAALEPGDVPCYQVDDAVSAALFGELFSVAARAQGACGAVVDGPVRDVRQIRELGYPVFARGVSPYDTRGRAEVVAHDVPIVCGGVPIETGDLVVADDDGVVVVPAGRAAAVAAAAAAKRADESGALADLLRGDTVHEVWNRWRAL
jgi:4-hydroxy-4-methyl-2-oxoglutarate aldolase